MGERHPPLLHLANKVPSGRNLALTQNRVYKTTSCGHRWSEYDFGSTRDLQSCPTRPP